MGRLGEPEFTRIQSPRGCGRRPCDEQASGTRDHDSAICLSNELAKSVSCGGEKKMVNPSRHITLQSGLEEDLLVAC